MTSDTPELQAILRRIETLETANRRLRRTGLAIALVAVVVLGMAQVRPSRSVEAQESVSRKTQGGKTVPALTAEEIANKFEWVDKDCRTWGADGKIDIDQTCLIVKTVGGGHLVVIPNEYNSAWTEEMGDPKTSRDKWIKQFFSLKRSLF